MATAAMALAAATARSSTARAAPRLATVAQAVSANRRVARQSILAAATAQASTTVRTRVKKTLRVMDFLIYPPGPLYKQILQSRTPAGGMMTSLLPCCLCAYFAYIYVHNEQMSNVASPAQLALTAFPALQMGVKCATNDAYGNANPLCPLTGGVVPPPIGFQLVAGLSGTRCTNSISHRGDTNYTWLSEMTSAGIAAVEAAVGVPQAEIGGNSDEFQLASFEGLASDVAINASDIWASAGSYLASLQAPFETEFSQDAYTQAAALSSIAAQSKSAALASAHPRRIRTDILADVVDPNDVSSDPFAAAARAAAAAQPTVVDIGPIPLCPYPDVEYSASLIASPAVSGLGYLVMLAPHFNWSAFLTEATDASKANDATQHFLLPTADGRIVEPTVITSVKGMSALGGAPFAAEAGLWPWYARTMSFSASADISMPYIAYDISVTRTTFSNGSKPIVTAQAIVSAGLISHRDAVNYYGYGGETPIVPMAGCGDLYILNTTQIRMLYSLAQQMGYTGSIRDFVHDNETDDGALADLLPALGTVLAGNCSSPEAAEQGWPVPMCDPVQTARLRNATAPGAPLTFSASPSQWRQLAALYEQVQATTSEFIHSNLLSEYMTKPHVLASQAGWKVAGMQAQALSALMQLQHGCGVYCTEPVRSGVGMASSVWIQPQASQADLDMSTSTTATNADAPSKLLLVYVQRRRPQLICDNATTSLPWLRTDSATEFFQGDISRIFQAPGPSGWATRRLPAPMAVVLFRTSGWTEVSVTSAKQSVLTLIGSTLGISTTIYTLLLLIKRYMYMTKDVMDEVRERRAIKRSQSASAATRSSLARGVSVPYISPDALTALRRRAARSSSAGDRESSMFIPARSRSTRMKDVLGLASSTTIMPSMNRGDGSGKQSEDASPASISISFKQ